MKIEFWGAARTVTGSMHLVESGGRRILLDCGTYHGRREEAFERNRNLPFDAASIDVVLLSHAHIDHCGNTLDRFAAVPYDRPRERFPGITTRFIDAGHMLGSASVVLHLEIGGRRPAAAPPVQRRRRARRSRHHDPVRRLPGARYPGPADPGRRAPDPDLRGAVHARGERPPERRDGSGDGRGAASPGCRCRHAEPSSSSTEPRAGGARAAGPPPGSPEAPRPQDEAPAAGVSPALKRARLFAITEQASSTSVAQ